MAEETRLDHEESVAHVRQQAVENFAAYQRGLEDYILQRIIGGMNRVRRFIAWSKSPGLVPFVARLVYVAASIALSVSWLMGWIQ